MTEYPPTRVYRTRAKDVRVLSPHFTRVTLTDPSLAHFGTGGLDQRIKLLLPAADGTLPEDIGLFDLPVAEWYPAWRALPGERRGAMRTYTVRGIRPEAHEIDVDFVLHGTDGPASAWASAARPGDELVVLGPDARSARQGGGIEWKPGDASAVLLAGDETAAPAICSILESLEADRTGHAFIEVPHEDDRLPVAAPAGVQVTWLPRGDAPHGAPLETAVRAWGADHRGGAGADLPDPDADALLWEVPVAAADGGLYAWLAGEAGVITGLRRHLVRDLGFDRRSVAFMGYWRRGRSEAN
ncbi:siderophore-interacting protein [Microbacterium marinilacus]|uniref:FAD-binding FR-type domain-containing protein n=1 Tax=Microbacterium marinilacus TaxID=415209 RepID=A0ABP7B931_9MICO|nr:siderophore-interacting protein [Microbacterium marinilacus]MBY0687347.1 siderophore-interacting protein [Microbacterium marinilacus]